MEKYKIILSGGGTGGHIYPAVSVAEALKAKLGEKAEIMFVGAEGKMEMEKIPTLGYRIEGLPVAGLQRRLAFSNLSLPAKIWKSLRKARKILTIEKADIVVGFGGYASAPVLWSAQRMGIPTIIQEQNSYAGVTNKILSKKARNICVAYDGMERFFPADKIIHTGNPLRGSFSPRGGLRLEALRYFRLSTDRPVVLVVGGSLGTRTLNEVMKKHLVALAGEKGIQFIWQTGKYYKPEIDEFMRDKQVRGLWYGDFIERMDLAYAAADVVVSRSGACTVSELCLVGKPVVFIPSPNVAEDHQTKNAMALVEKNAALMVANNKALDELPGIVESLLRDSQKLAGLSSSISKLGIPDSADRIADLVIGMLYGVPKTN